MDLQIKGRVALVTGGSKGIGAGIVRQLSREGVKVVVCARASTAMTELEAEVKSEGGDCLTLSVDVFDPVAVRAAVDTAAAYWGGLDILVNNVGGAMQFGGFEDLNDNDWMRSYEFNVMSTVRFTRAALPHLRRSTLKRVINVSSISAQQPGFFNPHYTVTKAAVVNLGKHLANIWAKEQILVNTVCPGPVHSDSWEGNIQRVARGCQLSLADAKTLIEEQESSKIPLGVIGEPWHVATLVAFLASPLSSWTTGSCIHVNGGKIMAS